MSEDYEAADQAFLWCVDSNLHRRRLWGSHMPCCVIHDVWHARGLIGNGGFHSFCSIATRRDIKNVAESYRTIGAERYSQIILAAQQLFADAKARLRRTKPDADADDVRSLINEELNGLEREFYAAREAVTSLVARYAEKHMPK